MKKPRVLMLSGIALVTVMVVLLLMTQQPIAGQDEVDRLTQTPTLWPLWFYETPDASPTPAPDELTLLQDFAANFQEAEAMFYTETDVYLLFLVIEDSGYNHILLERFEDVETAETVLELAEEEFEDAEPFLDEYRGYPLLRWTEVDSYDNRYVWLVWQIEEWVFRLRIIGDEVLSVDQILNDLYELGIEMELFPEPDITPTPEEA